VSSEYCETNLGLLLTILERSQDAVVRSNLVVALGDMAVCFNHLIDENTDFLYRRLNDGDPSVKRTCLMTLTFLILAGQVKVKGQLGEMAKCLEDSDKKIADMARMFFTELSTKDNAVYNQFIDMFSVLSADSALSEEALKRIVKFLAGFVEKVCLCYTYAASMNNRLTSYRINMLNSSLLNLPRGCPARRTRDSGMMLRMRLRSYNIKMRRFRRWLLRASRSCKRLRSVVGCGVYSVMIVYDELGVIPGIWDGIGSSVLAFGGI
jgi:hypothetical protein